MVSNAPRPLHLQSISTADPFWTGLSLYILTKTSWHLDIFKSNKIHQAIGISAPPKKKGVGRHLFTPQRPAFLRHHAGRSDWRWCFAGVLVYHTPSRSACRDVIWSTLGVEFMSGADNKKHLLHPNPKHLKISSKCLVNWVVGHLFGWFHLNHTPGSLNHGKVMISEPRKKKTYFPLNPGCWMTGSLQWLTSWWFQPIWKILVK